MSAALEAFRKKYTTEDEGHIVKSLSYFADADGSPLPIGLDPEKWAGIKIDFEARVRAL